ncbi:SxtJ family membrane protein [Baaleninema sp.]|uniref:SxtJ family membrane protein n=1 Tax=Baaleninema sp. TaxID=3101197 RepID=UPI003D0408F4
MNLLKRAWKYWQAFGHFMGNFIARLVLTLFYFIIFAPFALVTRIFLDPLGRKANKNASLWLDRQTRDLKIRDSKYQF